MYDFTILCLKAEFDLLFNAKSIIKYYFEKRDVKAVVMACNTTSANVYEEYKNFCYKEGVKVDKISISTDVDYSTFLLEQNYFSKPVSFKGQIAYLPGPYKGFNVKFSFWLSGSIIYV